MGVGDGEAGAGGAGGGRWIGIARRVLAVCGVLSSSVEIPITGFMRSLSFSLLALPWGRVVSGVFGVGFRFWKGNDEEGERGERGGT